MLAAHHQASFLVLFILLMSCSGQNTQQDHQNLFLVSGGSAAAAHKVEVLNLQQGDSTCTGLPDFPSIGGSVGTHMASSGVVLVCGGLMAEIDIQLASNRCFNYNAAADSWVETNSTLEERASARAVQLSPTRWWVTGGYNGAGNLSSTEVYTANVGFSKYVDMPVASYAHSLVNINSKYAMLIGGWSNKAWALDTRTQRWIALRNLPLETAHSQAGLVTHNGTTEVVVAAGSSSISAHATQIFSTHTLTWRLGSDFPVKGLHSASSVPYGDSFLIVGGQYPMADGSMAYSDDVWTYNATTGGWVLMPVKLSTGRSMAAAFLVPDDVVACGGLIGCVVDVRVLCGLLAVSFLAIAYA